MNNETTKNHGFSKYCTKCGECCRNKNPTEAATMIKEMRDGGKDFIPIELTVFPFPMINGACSKLTLEGLCSVYNTPEFPLICDIGKTADALHIPRDLLFHHNAKACLQAQEKAGWKGDMIVVPNLEGANERHPLE
jgi:Fe-S-cluster containining protein